MCPSDVPMRMLMIPCTVSDHTCVRRDTQHILRETRAKSSQKKRDDNGSHVITQYVAASPPGRACGLHGPCP